MQQRADRICEHLGLPHDLTGWPMVHLIANRRIRIDQHTGLREISADLVRVQTPRGCIAVTGEGLRVESLERDWVMISGFLANIDLSGLA